MDRNFDFGPHVDERFLQRCLCFVLLVQVVLFSSVGENRNGDSNCGLSTCGLCRHSGTAPIQTVLESMDVCLFTDDVVLHLIVLLHLHVHSSRRCLHVMAIDDPLSPFGVPNLKRSNRRCSKCFSLNQNFLSTGTGCCVR